MYEFHFVKLKSITYQLHVKTYQFIESFTKNSLLFHINILLCYYV